MTDAMELFSVVLSVLFAITMAVALLGCSTERTTKTETELHQCLEREADSHNRMHGPMPEHEVDEMYKGKK